MRKLDVLFKYFGSEVMHKLQRIAQSPYEGTVLSGSKDAPANSLRDEASPDEVEDPVHVLRTSFAWAETMEGFGYWREQETFLILYVDELEREKANGTQE